jgi:hypothetical protein
MPERRTNPSAIKRHLSPSSLLSSLGSGNGADGGSQKGPYGVQTHYFCSLEE